MSAFVLKIVACISMFIDHIGYIVFGGFSFFNYIGRLAFPIFAFQIAEGYKHTKNIKKYFSRLLIFAIISQVPFSLFYYVVFGSIVPNVIFTLFFGLICLCIYDKYNKFVGIASVLFLGLIAELLKFDYGIFGIILILIFHIFQNKKIHTAFFFILAVCIKYFMQIASYGFIYEAVAIYSLLAFFTSLSTIFILLYNGKKGKNAKYLFYIFYPAHLLLLYVLYLIM